MPRTAHAPISLLLFAQRTGTSQHGPWAESELPVAFSSMSEEPDAFDESKSAEKGPPPILPVPHPPAFALSDREESVASELGRIDPQLAGLFRLGLELSARTQSPGTSYLIAEAGRELNIGVVNALAESAPELSAADLAAIPEDDRYRGTIAMALRLSPRHPLVDAWAEMNRRFNGEAHLVPKRTAPSPAASDFQTLAALLIGRLAPYFEAQDEADALLALPAPGPEHLEPLRGVLVRPALRTYFLRSLSNPRWLSVLRELRAFESPPRRLVHPDQSWSMVAWLEGEYLTRVASDEPDAVARILTSVPTDNDNPAVWDVVARAAAKLPPELAAPILSRIRHGLQEVPHVVLPEALVALAKHVAPIDPQAVIALLDVLLWFRRRLAEAGRDDAETVARYRFSTVWLLQRIDLHDLQEIASEVVPAVAATDARAILAFLVSKLASAIRRVNPEWRTETARSTTHWCRDLAGSDDRDDVRALLAIALAEVAIGLATRGQNDAQDAQDVLDAHVGLPGGIRQRVTLHIVANVAPNLQKYVDELLSRPDLFEWELPGREVGEVLRRRFADGSDGARQALVRLLEQGPKATELERLMEWGRETGGDATSEAARAHWQRRHLRRFGEHLPEELAQLATSIGYRPAPLEFDELALIEDGWSAGRASWVSERSPIDSEQMATASVEELATEIRAWAPKRSVDAPTLRGLNTAVLEMAAADPERATVVGRALLSGPRTPRGLSGILAGLGKAHQKGRPLPWEPLADVVHEVLTEFPDAESDEWRDIRRAAVDLIDVVVDEIPEAVIGTIMAAAIECLQNPDTWVDDWQNDIRSMDGVLTASLNMMSGRTTRAVIRLALREFRLRTAGLPEDHPGADMVRREIGLRLHALVEVVASQRGSSAVAAQGALGAFLPQLVWLAPEWWETRAEELVRGGITDPVHHPIWPSYLARAHLFNQTFKRLRTYYAAAARKASPVVAEGDSRTWEPERHLAEHVFHAFLRGLVDIGNDDALMETTFANVSQVDRGHAYWTVFRSWNDAEKKGEIAPTEVVDRLVEFWEWRLRELEQRADDAARADEADSLLWFCRTPFVPPLEAIRLGIRTLAFVRKGSGNLHALWEAFAPLASIDVDGTFAMLERAVDVELRSEYRYIPADDAGPPLREALVRGTAGTKARAVRLLNRLGDAGFAEFGRFRA